MVAMRSFSKIVILLLVLEGCIDRLDTATVNQGEGTLIVDGYISDEKGPYQVTMVRSSAVDGILNNPIPVEAKSVLLINQDKSEELMTYKGDGLYESDPDGMRGTVGEKYFIRIELMDGTMFESDPEEILPTGKVDSVYYQFVSSKPESGPTAYGFNVFMNASTLPEGGYARWRYTGIFSLETFPHLNKANCNCCSFPGGPEPLPCSGYSVNENGLVLVRECTCCVSYVSEPESAPHLNDNAAKTDGTFKKVEMGYVDFNEYSFSRDRYMLKVDQMSLTREAYEYWKVFRDQKQGVESLFQPALGKARTNIRSINSAQEAGGFFYATSIHTKVAFIVGSRDASIRVPQYRIQPPQTNCGLWSTGSQIFLHSTTVKPPQWVD
ncbi:MAG: DUF4249 family protein [Cyclobacteriaceae bacterium]|nr:DUF4249 family protein [Cyclobacteriaceae bacterium]